MKELYFITNSIGKYWSPFQQLFSNEKRYMFKLEAIFELQNAVLIDCTSKIMNKEDLSLDTCIRSIEENTFDFFNKANQEKILYFLYQYKNILKNIKE